MLPALGEKGAVRGHPRSQGLLRLDHLLQVCSIMVTVFQAAVFGHTDWTLSPACCANTGAWTRAV